MLEKVEEKNKEEKGRKCHSGKVTKKSSKNYIIKMLLFMDEEGNFCRSRNSTKFTIFVQVLARLKP